MFLLVLSLTLVLSLPTTGFTIPTSLSSPINPPYTHFHTPHSNPSTLRLPHRHAFLSNPSHLSSQRSSHDSTHIRNFCIIAHINHGKSTLADRFLEHTQTISSRNMKDQILDDMELEKERGITIKLRAARVKHESKRDGGLYTLNFIDTPGHVDFTYEVSRSLAACEGALLLVDASQGIEAQTLANAYLAMENNLTIIPILNKLDLPNADPERVTQELHSTFGFDTSNILSISAKQDTGIHQVFEAIIDHIPPPPKDTGGPFRALIFDSYYDSFRGVIVFFRVVDGCVKKGDRVRYLATGDEQDIIELGILQPQQVPVNQLHTGEVGYMISHCKDPKNARVGDTLTKTIDYKTFSTIEPLPGYKESMPMVYSTFFPVDTDNYDSLRNSLNKLHLNDAAMTYTPETSEFLGFGFQCGFLGLLHMEIVKERLRREYELELIVTSPAVVYKIVKDGVEIVVDSPSKLPNSKKSIPCLEPYVQMEIVTTSTYNGAIIKLAQERRGTLKEFTFLTPTRSMFVYELPLAEVILTFFDVLKSRTKGHASMQYSFLDYRPADIVRLDVHINYELIPPLSTIVHKTKEQSLARKLAETLKKSIPPQQFRIPIQVYCDSITIASESINPWRKDVTANLSGGDYSRKRKLLEKQKKGKKRMKAIGKVNVPPEAFMAAIQLDR